MGEENKKEKDEQVVDFDKAQEEAENQKKIEEYRKRTRDRIREQQERSRDRDQGYDFEM